MAFETKDVAYPVRFANFQRNSNVPVMMKSRWNPVWFKKYSDINIDYSFIPYNVLVRDNLVGVRYDAEMLLFNSQGNMVYQMPLSASGSVVLGKTAMAYLVMTHQINYRDYEFNLIENIGTLPELNEWSYELLMCPTFEDILAVVQFTGGPQYEPRKYYIYKLLPNKRDVDWFHEFDGVANHALLTNDENNIILVNRNNVSIFNTDSGENTGSFKINFDDTIEPDVPSIASLDKNDNLVILADRIVDEKTDKYLAVYSPDGKELWSFKLNEPNLNQPPACDNDGRIFIIDGLQLHCLKDGEIDWTAILKPAERNWITITSDNHAVVINGSLLALFAPNGEKLFERLITKTDDQFYAPPALDKDGHIFVAGQKALYCFE